MYTNSLTSWLGNCHLTGACGYDSYVYIPNVWTKAWGGISGQTLGLDRLFGGISVGRKYEIAVRKEVRIKQVWVRSMLKGTLWVLRQLGLRDGGRWRWPGSLQLVVAKPTLDNLVFQNDQIVWFLKYNWHFLNSHRK